MHRTFCKQMSLVRFATSPPTGQRFPSISRHTHTHYRHMHDENTLTRSKNIGTRRRTVHVLFHSLLLCSRNAFYQVSHLTEDSRRGRRGQQGRERREGKEGTVSGKRGTIEKARDSMLQSGDARQARKSDRTVAIALRQDCCIARCCAGQHRAHRQRHCHTCCECCLADMRSCCRCACCSCTDMPSPALSTDILSMRALDRCDMSGCTMPWNTSFSA